MKSASTLTVSTDQLQPHQASSAPSVEPQVEAHLMANDVSFSSYLKPIEPDKRTSEEHPGSTADDSELSVFEAHKYFNEGSQHDQALGSSKRVSPLKETNHLNSADSSSLQRFSSASSVGGYGPGYRTRSLTSSEASWNSQSGLLPNNARRANSGTQRDGKRGYRVIPRWLLFRPKCPCSGKKSVQVKGRPADNHGASPLRQAIKPNMPAEVRGVKVNVIPDSQERYMDRVGELITTPEDRFPSEIGRRHLLVSVPVPQKPLTDSSISSSIGFTFPMLPPSTPSPLPPPSVRMPQKASQSSHASPDPLQNPTHHEPLKVFNQPSDEFINSRKPQENHQVLRFSIGLKYQTGMVADEGDELESDASSDLPLTR
ncbi:hypothetical protein SAY87_008102 [Trapa incisa]|uniref:Uncharacterized protein n=1 Tax=Trapa incisa TaxID=236973 RepID=A0AAN7QJ03_9MYRT|nr:hypothetical protein SAY87_008102 [Trapa incisa]